MKNNKMVKIAVPVLVVALVGGLWFVKNGMAGKKETRQESMVDSGAEGSNVANEEKPAPGEPDFTFEITDKLDFDAYKKHGLPIIADYGSEKCGPCMAMHPDLEAIHEEYKGRAFVKYADVWKNFTTTDNVPVRVTPTQVLVSADGKPFVPSEELQKEIGGFSTQVIADSGEEISIHEGMLSKEDFHKILKEMGVK